MSLIGLDMVKTWGSLLPASRISALVAFTTSALHHSMSRDWVCVCVCVCVSEWVSVCMFVDALCVQTFSMRVDFVHSYCCGFICALSHVLECVHLHRSVCECAWVQTHAHTHACHTCTHKHTTCARTHISISSIVVLTVLCHAWTSPPFPHIYAKLRSCQSVTLVT